MFGPTMVLGLYNIFGTINWNTCNILTKMSLNRRGNKLPRASHWPSTYGDVMFINISYTIYISFYPLTKNVCWSLFWETPTIVNNGFPNISCTCCSAFAIIGSTKFLEFLESPLHSRCLQQPCMILQSSHVLWKGGVFSYTHYCIRLLYFECYVYCFMLVYWLHDSICLLALTRYHNTLS